MKNYNLQTFGIYRKIIISFELSDVTADTKELSDVTADYKGTARKELILHSDLFWVNAKEQYVSQS